MTSDVVLALIAVGVAVWAIVATREVINNLRRMDQTVPVLIYKLYAYPDEYAVTKGTAIAGGAFFLDFSRKLTRYKRYYLFHTGWLVPVVHQGEENGGYMISICRNDPYFDTILGLWQQNHPRKKPAPAQAEELLLVIAHFANQFPEDSKTPE